MSSYGAPGYGAAYSAAYSANAGGGGSGTSSNTTTIQLPASQQRPGTTPHVTPSPNRTPAGNVLAPGGTPTSDMFNAFIYESEAANPGVRLTEADRLEAQRGTFGVLGSSGSDYGSDYGGGGGGGGGYGYGGGGGGGGGGETIPGLTQEGFDGWMEFIGGAKPQAGVWNDVDLPDWEQREYMPWDDTAWTTARGQVSDQISAGRASGMADFDVAQAQLDTYRNPYGNVRTTNPGTTDAMRRILQSQGVGMDAADQTAAEGRYLDAGFGYTQRLLAGAADQRQAGNYRALAGDRRHFSETLAGEERVMQMQITMSLNKAKADYEKNKWLYGEEQAKYIFENEKEEILMNAQGKQAMDNSNLAAINGFNQGVVDPITRMWLEGRDSKGVQGLQPLDPSIFA